MATWQSGMEFVPLAMQEPLHQPTAAITWKPGMDFVPHGQQSQWQAVEFEVLQPHQHTVWTQAARDLGGACRSNFMSKASNLKDGPSGKDSTKAEDDTPFPTKDGQSWREAAKEAAVEARKALAATKLEQSPIAERDSQTWESINVPTHKSETSTDCELSTAQSIDVSSTEASDQESLSDEAADEDTSADFRDDIHGRVRILQEASPMASSVLSRAFLLASRQAFQDEACLPAMVMCSAQRLDFAPRSQATPDPPMNRSQRSNLNIANQVLCVPNFKMPTTRISSKQPVLLPQSAGAHRVVMANKLMPRVKQLQREVNSLLNKVCPDNLHAIVRRVAATELRSVEELDLVIRLLFQKALAEPHYCATYTDMVVALQRRTPEFASQNDDKPMTFMGALLSATQSEFESLTDVLTLSDEEVKDLDSEEIELVRKQRKDRVLANIKFIGHLFLRRILSAKVICSILQKLARCGDEVHVPAEPTVECLCELLATVGFTLEKSPVGRTALASVIGRLQDLKARSAINRHMGAGLYCKRIQFAIQDIVDMRADSWTTKSFKPSAKTKEEIRHEQEIDLKATAGKRIRIMTTWQ